ncbi:MAG TPA: relaxase/mobilization nuclease domain-containing protein [Algoriphagus sp.]|nr:relaxase/mobilization nuclease domain-containing protein [Algoriphagus sp.]
MVVRISTGKSIQGVLRYNEQKRHMGHAKLIAHQGFFNGAEKLTLGQLSKRFEALLSGNRRTKTNAVHISLNFAPGERLDQERLEEISKEYLKQIGFGNQPCLIYQHHDAGHPHVHLVTVNIDPQGKRIETHNLGRNQSEIARKELEVLYGLVPAEKQQFVGPDIKSLGKLSYGESPTKAGIQSVLNQVWQNYTFTSFGEYNAILKCYGMEADRGERDSQRFKQGGLIYQVLDARGRRKGVPIKASSFYLKPTVKKLELRYSRDLAKKKTHIPVLRDKIIQEIDRSSTLKDFEGKLKKQGIDVSINWTEKGAIYGLVYVDHRLQVSIKGSDLGKEFGATGVAKKFGLGDSFSISKDQSGLGRNWITNQNPSQKKDEESVELGLAPFGTSEDLLDLGRLSDSAFQGPVPKSKKKKKKTNSNSADS